MQTTFAPTLASKPLFFGLSQWISGLLAVKTPVSQMVSHSDIKRVEGIRALQRMARDIEDTQPSMAAELRNFAARS